MPQPPDASASDDGLQARLLALLTAGDVDAALQAGLMAYPVSAVAADAPIRAVQERLRAAWEARDRHRARDARLARHATERAARRASASDAAAIAAKPPAPAPSPATSASPGPPALPPAAAAALARARSRVSGKPPA